MKALSATILLLAVFTTLHAQRFSVGARTGIGKWSKSDFIGGSEKEKLIWEKEVFGRVTIGKHFAFELGGFEQDGRKYSYDQNYLDTIRSITVIHRDWKYAFCGLNLRAQYHIGHARYKGFQNYIGIVIAPALETGHSTFIQYTAATRETVTQSEDDRIKGWQTGVEDMIQYRLSPNLAFHLLLSYRSSMFSTKGYYEAWSSADGYVGLGVQAQFGAAYTFLKKQKIPTPAP